MAELGIESTEAGSGEPLELGHDRRLGVLRDHVAGVDARVRGQEGIEPAVARLVEEPVGPALGDAGQVGDGDGQEVQHVADRGAVEVAVGLDPAVEGDHRVVDGRAELDQRDPFGMIHGVAYGTGDLRRAAQRVGVLDPGARLGTV